MVMVRMLTSARDGEKKSDLKESSEVEAAGFGD